jgi:alcohol dehydrogenase, propanol-preferring
MGAQSIRILGSYVGGRQDAIEAVDIAARGEVTVHFERKGLSELKEYVHAAWASISILRTVISVYEAMEQGKFAGRMVLDMDK